MTARPPFTGRDLAIDRGELTGLRPDRMLEHARQLAARGTDTGTPRTVHARRAVSAAYYALFHRVTINLAWRASTDLPDSLGWALCRTFDHGQIKEAAALLADRAVHQPEPSTTRTTLTMELVDLALKGAGMPDFARGFPQLLRARQDADYDHFTVIDRLTALQAVREAERLINVVDAVYLEPAWQAFTTLVLLKSTLTKRAEIPRRGTARRRPRA